MDGALCFRALWGGTVIIEMPKDWQITGNFPVGVGLWANTNYPPTKACLWYPVFGHVRIGGKEMWIWESSGASLLSAGSRPTLPH